MTATFRWLLYDGGERNWSRPHQAAPATCMGCCCNDPPPCPDCGARRHQEPVEGLVGEDGWQVVHALLCEQCRLDEFDEPAEIAIDAGPGAQ